MRFLQIHHPGEKNISDQFGNLQTGKTAKQILELIFKIFDAT